MDELVAFVRRCLDAQEAALIAYRDHRAGKTPCDNWDDYDDSCSIHIATAAATEYSDVDYGLAEVEAKRRILELHAPLADYRGRVQCEYCAGLCHSRSGLGCEDPADAMYPCDTVQLLTQPFAGREGWRTEWGLDGA